MKGSFKYLNDRFPDPFIYFDSRNPYPFIYLKREIGTLFGGGEPPHIGHYREYPGGGVGRVMVRIFKSYKACNTVLVPVLIPVVLITFNQ